MYFLFYIEDEAKEDRDIVEALEMILLSCRTPGV